MPKKSHVHNAVIASNTNILQKANSVFLFGPNEHSPLPQKLPQPYSPHPLVTHLSVGLREGPPERATAGHDDRGLVVAVCGPVGVVLVLVVRLVVGGLVRPASPGACRGGLAPTHRHRNGNDEGPHAARLPARGGPLLRLWMRREEEEEEILRKGQTGIKTH